MGSLRCPTDAIFVALGLRLFGTGFEPVCVKRDENVFTWECGRAFEGKERGGIDVGANEEIGW